MNIDVEGIVSKLKMEKLRKFTSSKELNFTGNGV